MLLPQDLCAMIEAFLTPSWVSTVGDPHKKWHVVDRGVPQESPLSPSLYNLFIDELSERISQVQSDVATVPGVLFAADVLLTANSPQGLQILLDTASKRGRDRK